MRTHTRGRAQAVGLLLSAGLVAVTAHEHKCIHDKLAAARANRGHYSAGEQNYAYEGRRLQAQTWSPIRILPVYDPNFGTDSSFSSGTPSWIRNTLVPTALDRFKNMLKVIPVSGGLRAHRTCLAYDESFTPAICSQFDSESSVRVPSMSGEAVDVDFVLSSDYLADDTVVDPATATSGKTLRSLPAGAGFSNADMVVFVTGISTSYCDPSSGTIAYALLWQKDQYDRPVFGQINLCPAALSGYYTSGDAETAINLVMHEMTHTMVMDASLFPLFRYKDVARSPRTPRDPLYPSLPAPEYNMMYGCQGSNTLFYVPANATLAWFSERGMFCSRANASSTGGCVTRLVTPAVREAARTFFGCADLAGAEIENYDTSDCAFIGSHWESRVLWADMMNPYATGAQQGFTLLTLALYDDSGWYAANFSSVSRFPTQYGTTHGYKQGCGFARDSTCITRSGPSGSPTYTAIGSPPHFATATTSGRQICRLDRQGYGASTVGTFTSALPTQYRYFANNRMGGSNPQLDYCPMLSVVTGGECTKAANRWSGDANQGMLYGAGSMCLSTTLMDATVTGASTQPVGCYKVTCNAGGMVATITGQTRSGVQVQASCTGAGQTVFFAGYTGALTCPNVTALCANPVDVTAADIASMNLAAVQAEQATGQPIQQLASVTRMPSFAPYAGTSTSGKGSAGLSLVAGPIIGIIIAVVAAVVIGVFVSLYINKRKHDRQRAAAAAAAAAGPGGVAPPGTMVVGVPYVVGAAPATVPVAAYPQQQTGAGDPVNIAPGAGVPQQPPQQYPQRQQPQPQYYASPYGPGYGGAMGPPAGGVVYPGYQYGPPQSVGYGYPAQPAPLQQQQAGYPGMSPAVLAAGGRPTAAGQAAIMGPLGIVPQAQGGASAPPGYSASAVPQHRGGS